MGLDVSHDCWHGAYSAFHRWRQRLAALAGYPPLDLMDGFYLPGEIMIRFPSIWADDSEKDAARLAERDQREMPGSVFRNHPILAALPIPWERFESDPLSTLLRHSDCDGEIAPEECSLIAGRLSEILPLLPDEDGGGHVRNWRVTTQRFIDGLRAAADAEESVRFA